MATDLTGTSLAKGRSHVVRWVTLGIVVAVFLPLVVVLGSRLGQETRISSPLLGKPAPAFDLATLDGGRIRSADLAGRPYVVNFWASWCVPCVQEHPHLEAFHRRWSSRGVTLVGVVFSDTGANARRWQKERNVDWPLAEDPGARTALDYGVLRPPETYVVDASGIVVTKFVGAVGPTSLDDVLEASALGGAPTAGRPLAAALSRGAAPRPATRRTRARDRMRRAPASR